LVGLHADLQARHEDGVARAKQLRDKYTAIKTELKAAQAQIAGATGAAVATPE